MVPLHRQHRSNLRQPEHNRAASCPAHALLTIPTKVPPTLNIRDKHRDRYKCRDRGKHRDRDKCRDQRPGQHLDRVACSGRTRKMQRESPSRCLLRFGLISQTLRQWFHRRRFHSQLCQMRATRMVNKQASRSHLLLRPLGWTRQPAVHLQDRLASHLLRRNRECSQHVLGNSKQSHDYEER